MNTPPDASSFQGWVAHDPSAIEGHMRWETYTPKPWEETDIDIRITHCGVCSTDTHILASQLGPTAYPLVVGHEIVGIAVRVGRDANTSIKVGDRVGVGAQCDACLCRKPPHVSQDWSSCEECVRGKENWCQKLSTTYNGVFHSAGAGGAKTMGGYAKYHRCPAHFVIKIPDGLRSEHAAPLMCAGATTYAALLGSWKSRTESPRPLKGMKVGIIGIGGLGHVGIQFAKAMGADVIVAISRSRGKRRDALALGATDYIATAEDEGWQQKYAGSLDVIISTISGSHPLTEHLLLLRRGGRYVLIGFSGDQHLAGFDVNMVVLRQLEITGSLICSPTEMADMLQFAADHGIKPWVEIMDMKEANRAVVDMEAGKPRYRIVLENRAVRMAKL